MRIYVFASPRAKAEIDEIVAYLEEYSATATARFLDALGRTYQMLSEHPEIGPRGERPGTRRLVMGNYIVSYRRKGDEVEIFAVRHARRRDARF